VDGRERQVGDAVDEKWWMKWEKMRGGREKKYLPAWS
jgi:hypothetical protein